VVAVEAVRVGIGNGVDDTEVPVGNVSAVEVWRWWRNAHVRVGGCAVRRRSCRRSRSRCCTRRSRSSRPTARPRLPREVRVSASGGSSARSRPSRASAGSRPKAKTTSSPSGRSILPMRTAAAFAASRTVPKTTGPRLGSRSPSGRRDDSHRHRGRVSRQVGMRHDGVVRVV
jgi:hypothetical protein